MNQVDREVSANPSKVQKPAIRIDNLRIRRIKTRRILRINSQPARKSVDFLRIGIRDRIILQQLYKLQTKNQFRGNIVNLQT